MRNGIPLVLTLLFALPCPSECQYVHPSLREKRLDSVLVLPARIQIQKQGMKGVESMLGGAQECGKEIQALVSDALKERGLGPLSTIAHSQAEEGQNDMKYALADVQNSYDRIESVLERKPKDVTKGRFSLGEIVDRLRPYGLHDAIVFIRGYGIQLTKGKQIFGLLTPTANIWSNLRVSIALVDSTTGDVLFFARVGATGDPTKRVQALSKPIRKSFQRLTKGTPPTTSIPGHSVASS